MAIDGWISSVDSYPTLSHRHLYKEDEILGCRSEKGGNIMLDKFILKGWIRIVTTEVTYQNRTSWEDQFADHKSQRVALTHQITEDQEGQNGGLNLASKGCKSSNQTFYYYFLTIVSEEWNPLN